MNLVRCRNNHYYDAEKYSSCPHCGNAEGRMGTAVGSRDGEMTVNLRSAGGDGASGGSPGKVSSGTLHLRTPGREAAVGMVDVAGAAGEATVVGESVLFGRPGDDADTLGFFSGDRQETGETAPAFFSAPVPGGIKDHFNPVVGWLVCTKGPDCGMSFNLYTGKNYIGRDPGMDICITGDRSVSRIRHAIVVYEPRKGQFFAQPGESHQLVYCNDELILSDVLLKDRDKLTVGRTELVFVSFCDASFSWGGEDA